MFPIVDTAVGMAFVYLLLSLVSSAIREAAEGLLRKRSGALRSGVDRLLGAALAQELYQHGLIAPLADHPAGPSYIPASAFAAAVRDLTQSEPAQAGAELPDHVRQVLRSLERQAAGDAARFEAGLEAWFNSAMDTVAAAYQRHTRAWLALIGIAVTVAMNADSIRMAGALFGNPEVAARVADAAEKFVSTQREAAPREATPPELTPPEPTLPEPALPEPALPEPAQSLTAAEAAGRLSALGSPGGLPLGLPLGWTGTTPDTTPPWKPVSDWPAAGQSWKQCWKQYLLRAWLLLRWHWAGWLITVAAITVGAPFWFDLLGQVARFRQGGGTGGAPPRTPANP